jgi:hypothetical protein
LEPLHNEISTAAHEPTKNSKAECDENACNYAHHVAADVRLIHVFAAGFQAKATVFVRSKSQLGTLSPLC